MRWAGDHNLQEAKLLKSRPISLLHPCTIPCETNTGNHRIKTCRHPNPALSEYKSRTIPLRSFILSSSQQTKSGKAACVQTHVCTRRWLIHTSRLHYASYIFMPSIYIRFVINKHEYMETAIPWGQKSKTVAYADETTEEEWTISHWYCHTS